jgi:ureidoglycolate lyase
MRSLELNDLTVPGFKTVGTCHDMFHPAWEKLGDGKTVDFYRDILTLRLGTDPVASFSLCHVRTREPVIDAVEYHTSTEEAIISLDADIAMAFAPATPAASAPLDRMTAYRIPRGVLVVLKAGAWHSGPFVLGGGDAHILVALPERTYANDCIVKSLEPADRLRIAGL